MASKIFYLMKQRGGKKSSKGLNGIQIRLNFLKKILNAHVKLYILNLKSETLCMAINLNYFTVHSFTKGQFSSKVSRTKIHEVSLVDSEKRFSYGKIV